MLNAIAESDKIVPSEFPSVGASYSDHVSKKLEIFSEALERNDFDRLIIGSGSQGYRFRDDLYTPYFANAYFEEFAYLPDRPNSFLLVKPGNKPKLFIQEHDDYWHSEPASLNTAVANQFDVEGYVDFANIQSDGRTAYIGPDTNNLPEQLLDSLELNPESLLAHIDFHRAWKTDYEKDCLRSANVQAAKAHRVAEKYFIEGRSEYEIHMAYLAKLKCRDSELPYDSIVALNENAAVLHHMHLSTTAPEKIRSFLIDAGARHLGYAADVTRTYAAPDADPYFVALIEALDALQRMVVEASVSGQSYTAIHLLTCKLVANLLSDLGLVKVSADEVLSSGLISAFFPHGIGHFLGVQVHDKGGHMAAADGSPKNPPDSHPALRLTRDIEEGMAFTIEPGVYFIPKLLAPWRGKNMLNEPLVDKMIPYGGIRIEDNLIVHKNKVENLTRDAFAAL